MSEEKKVQEQENSSNQNIDVEYPKAKLHKRWFAAFLDLFLTIFFGMIFYGLTALTTNHVSAYINVVEQRDRIEKKSGLYEDGSPISTIMKSKEEDYSLKNETLRNAIEAFYNNSYFFSDDNAMNNYEERKKVAKEGEVLIFVYSDTTNKYEEGNFTPETYYNFYIYEIENYSLPLLSVNDDYQEATRIIVWTSVIEIVLSVGLGYFIAFNLIPIFRRRGRQTIGMYLFKISVVTNEALSPTGKTFVFRQLLVFFVGYLLNVCTAFIPLIISLAMMHLSKTGQDFFDFVTNTYVIDSSKKDIYLSYEEYFRKNRDKEDIRIESENIQLKSK